MNTTQDTINECKEQLEKITNDLSHPFRATLMDSYSVVIKELQRVIYVTEEIANRKKV